MSSKDRPSGGAREVARKRRAQEAVRGPRYSANAIAAYKRLQRQPTGAHGALAEAMETLRLAMRQAATDPGMPPEYRREQAARIAGYVVKAADPKRLIDEMGAELREAQRFIDAMREQDASQEPAGDPIGPPPADRH